MKLVTLRLENFRQHRNSTLEFESGVTGVIGANGAGKTTLVEAIGFALFGARAVRGKLEDVKTRRTPRAALMRVELRFEHDATLFTIVRGASEATLSRGGEAPPLASGTREVTNAISALLGMSYEEFIATYYTEQKGLEFLSGQRGVTEREKFVLRMLGFDRFERVQELLRTDRRDLRASVSGLELGLGDRRQLEERLALEQTEAQLSAARHEEAMRALSRAEADAGRARANLERFEVVHGTYKKLKASVHDLETRIDERATQLSRAEGEGAGFAVEQLEDSLEKLADVTRQLGEMEANRVALDLAVAHGEAEWRGQRTKLEAERGALVKQLEALEKQLRSTKAIKSGALCPTCEQPLGVSFDAFVESLAAKRLDLERSIENLEAPLHALTDPPAALLDAQAGRKKCIDQITELRREEGNLRSKVQENERRARIVAAIEHTRSELEKLRGERAVLLARLEELGFQEHEYMAAKGAHDAAGSLVHVARLQRVRHEGEMDTKSALVRRTEEELRNFDQKAQLLTQQRDRLALLEEGDLVLGEFRRYVNSTIRPRLAELASEFITELTDGRYTTVEVGADFAPTVQEDGEPKSVVSGGEEDILNLCMRLALSQFLAERAGHSFSLLILDEVFGSLDETRRRNLLELLEALGNRFEQIIVITHFDDVKEGVRHLLIVDYQETTGELSVAPVNTDASFEIAV